MQTSLTDDEYTVLLIAAEGQSMMAIGRWEKSVDALVVRGLLERKDKFNNFITLAGRQEAAKREKQDGNAVLEAYKRATGEVVGPRRDQLRMAGEELAQLLANAARTLARENDIPVELAVRQASEVVLDRALEILK